MPKPSEIFDTPEAISRVRGNEDWEDDFRKQFDELKLKPPKNSMKNAERELIIWYFRNLLTTKDQEKEEAVKAEQMRIKKEIAFHTPALTAKKPKAYNDGLLSGWYACREFVNLLTRALPTEDNK